MSSFGSQHPWKRVIRGFDVRRELVWQDRYSLAYTNSARRVCRHETLLQGKALVTLDLLGEEDPAERKGKRCFAPGMGPSGPHSH